MKKYREAVALAAILLLGAGCLATGCTGGESNGETVVSETGEAQTAITKTAEQEADEDGYILVWEDEFDGDSLNLEDWNYEYHEPGWVNNELQEYVDSPENVYVEDGHLVIQALKQVAADGTVSYTSGRINTQNKHDYTYGKFEIRAKMPIGAGFLPAIWMMPTDENLYGQWPKCGEIDIAEVLGDKPGTLYSTLHWGYPHMQGQGNYSLTLARFSDEYHVFACEWEPGEIRFYVDGMMYHKETDWYTKRDGFGEVTFPAPFDQPFYLILNLAVGGDWPGDPTEKTTFDEKAQLCVDYVRVYQKAEYDENVEKPVTEVSYREPDETGNYVLNSDFTDESDTLASADGWYFLKAKGGDCSAYTEDGMIVIETVSEGTEDYSVQLVQAEIPMIRGHKYRLSFDMVADETRDAIVAETAPTGGWARYLRDTKFEVSTEWTNYTFDFTMQSEDDPNGRIEFNLGHLGSTATIRITNVRLEFLGEDSMETDENCLPDGNFVYNGEFQEGSDRLDYWTAEACGTADFQVTNVQCVREFAAEVTGTSGENAVTLTQEGLKLYGGKEYRMTFTAHAKGAGEIGIALAGQTFTVSPTPETETYEFCFETPEEMTDTGLVFTFLGEGTLYLDDVSVKEDALLINGDFLGQMTGYEVYAYTETDVYYVVDNLNEQSAFCIRIEDTGDQDWKIQLKQNHITLEEGHTYKLSFEAKSTLDRTIMCALQRDGSSDDDWTPYSGTGYMDLTDEYTTYETTFTMEYPTDTETILSISMGAVLGEQITERHSITIDNILLEEVE